MDTSAEITMLLNKSNDGDEQARDRVLALLYEELHRIAKRYKGRETMRPTVLVNEAYLKLFGNDAQFENRDMLFAYAALAMRQIVINSAQKAKAQKRGGDEVVKLTLQDWDHASDMEIDYVALDDVLSQLEKVHPRHARIICLHYFAGFKILEIADVLSVSEATVNKDLRFAKAWIKKKLKS